MTLDELQVVFSQKGGQGVLAQISKISQAIDMFVKKHSKGSADVLKNYQKILQEIEKKQDASFKSIGKKAQENNKNIISLYDAEIDKLEELKKAREEAYGSNPQNGSAEGFGNSGRGKKGILGLLLSAAYLPRALNHINQMAEEARQMTFRRQNQEMLSGARSAPNAVGYDIALGGYGGIRGEGLESLRSFSAQLGAATRGDVSLLQTLGKWGVSGVSPYDDPMDVIKKIAARSRELSANERNAFFAEVGFTDAQASAALKGDFSIFAKKGMLTEVSADSRGSSETYATTVQETVANLDKLNQSLGIASNWYNKFIQQYPEAYNWVNAITGMLPDVASALSAMAAVKTLFGGGPSKNPIQKASGGGVSGKIAGGLGATVVKKGAFFLGLMAPNTAGDANKTILSELWAEKCHI